MSPNLSDFEFERFEVINRAKWISMFVVGIHFNEIVNISTHK